MNAASVSEGRFWLKRAGEASDHSLVLDSWIRGYKSIAVGAKEDAKSYCKFQDWLIKKLLGKCALLVACHPNETSYVLGYAVTSTNAVHYVWVRDKFRRKGIGADLIRPYLADSQPIVYTHRPTDEVRKDAWKLGLKSEMPIPAHWSYDRFHAYNLAVT